eukprot:TRINITY_DN1267_c0_g1_i1.p1 TRINITY_DN1267_c0_g1~~TRINITY_DN1267_c0_g1_i1.p1  ORF type:complete len:220 (+),score=53.59 TRINITY_DN1267_c0_g1_i1:144-803(+)
MLSLLEGLRARGAVKTDRVFDVMLSVDRKDFLIDTTLPIYEDRPLPYGWHTTISAPHMHGHCLELANIQPGHRCLDVGCGSGYFTVCMAYLAGPSGRAIGIDHIDGIVKQALINTTKHHGDLLNSNSVDYILADGMLGLPSRGPYDRIIVGAAIPCIPRPLIDQMAPGGIMVAPLGEKSGESGQNLTVFTKSATGIVTTEAVMGVRFAPLQTVEEQMRG